MRDSSAVPRRRGYPFPAAGQLGRCCPRALSEARRTTGKANARSLRQAVAVPRRPRIAPGRPSEVEAGARGRGLEGTAPVARPGPSRYWCAVTTNLQPPDHFHVTAAGGWLELGLPEEARRELAQLSPDARAHPETLVIEWDLSALERRWHDALGIASRLIEIDRTRPVGWINRSYALHELQRTTEARESLLPALPLFPEMGLIPYNLACYACQLGRLDEARQWLRQAMALDGRDTIIVRARMDPDLHPLRSELDLI